jgi:ParB-like chromosome segregation protein Spo0J
MDEESQAVIVGLSVVSAGSAQGSTDSTGPLQASVGHREGADTNSSCEPVPLDALVSAGSPRAGGVDESHVELLLEAQGPLPAILVHRLTMQIVDGYHRVAAAIRKGLKTIEARLIDGSLDAAFVEAVRANVTHGLPLSLGDRRSAAERILHSQPDWSDRAIASASGLSSKTIRAIRCATNECPQVEKRRGRDGRVRPLSAGVGRQLAAELLRQRPDASLREVAAEAGISPGTVRDVRLRLERGSDPVPAVGGTEGEGANGLKQLDNAPEPPADVNPVLRVLSNDPAFHMNAGGRELLRWLRIHAVNAVDSGAIVEWVPDHSICQLVELASRCASNWARIAREFERLSAARPE